MSAYIGGVTFTYPLWWVDKDLPVVVGSDTRTRSGNLVSLRGENTSQDFRIAVVRFEWTPRASVDTLQAYWQGGGQYSADFDGLGETHTVRFLAKNGVENVTHEVWGDQTVHAYVAGHPTDLYRGTLNLIIL